MSLNITVYIDEFAEISNIICHQSRSEFTSDAMLFIETDQIEEHILDSMSE